MGSYSGKHAVRAIAVAIGTFASGVAFYDRPGSWIEFADIAWAPFWQGVIMGLGALGINVATGSERNGSPRHGAAHDRHA